MTAYTDDRSFAQARATRPFAFIEKPFKVRSLLRTFELLMEQIADGEAEDAQEEEVSFMLKNSIFIKDKDKMVKILIEDILYIEAERAYSRIHTKGKEYLLATSLKTLEEKIAADYLMRVHRSFIINFHHIQEIKDNYVRIEQKAIPVSCSYWEVFIRKVKII
jgi:DNA-binding LytR/AlgR family response regulator